MLLDQSRSFFKILHLKSCLDCVNAPARLGVGLQILSRPFILGCLIPCHSVTTMVGGTGKDVMLLLVAVFDSNLPFKESIHWTFEFLLHVLYNSCREYLVLNQVRN